MFYEYPRYNYAVDISHYFYPWKSPFDLEVYKRVTDCPGGLQFL